MRNGQKRNMQKARRRVGGGERLEKKTKTRKQPSKLLRQVDVPVLQFSSSVQGAKRTLCWFRDWFWAMMQLLLLLLLLASFRHLAFVRWNSVENANHAAIHARFVAHCVAHCSFFLFRFFSHFFWEAGGRFFSTLALYASSSHWLID